MPGTAGCGIESVHERGQGAYNFELYYENLCALQSSVPLAHVKTQLDRNILDINADKIRLNDWVPIFKAISINKSLKKIAIHSFYEALAQTDSLSDFLYVDAPSSIRRAHTPSKIKPPALHSKDLTYQLSKAIKDCLTASEALQCLELEGLPFRPRDIQLIAKGLTKTVSLREISLESSRVGDALTCLCEGLKNASTVNTLNLSACSLADGAVEAISRVVKHQAIMRHSEAWKSSLRYRAPDLDCMPGLRRITLNMNPLLGDNAAMALSEALKDDLWLKAIDMQECGLTDRGAEAILGALRLNSTVLVVDIRGNHLVNFNLIKNIIQQVMINSDGKMTQYAWLPDQAYATKRQALMARTMSRSRTPKKAATYRTPSKAKTVVVSSNSARKRSATSPPITPRSVPRQRGLPWRTAERAQTAHKTRESSGSTGDSPTAPQHRAEVRRSSTCDEDSASDGELEGEAMGKTQAMDAQTVTLIKELQAENISLKRRLADESVARVAAEDRSLELARANRRLQSELRRASLSASTGADDELLCQVEAAFSKFNRFLDLVRDTGLGHLIQEAGLDNFATASSPIPPSHHQTGVVPLDFSDYVIDRQIAMQSDILPHAASSDSPKKSYAQQLTGSPTIAKYAAISAKECPEKPPKQPEVPIPDIESKTITIKTIELRDVSELETPKLTPREAPHSGGMKSLAEELSTEPLQVSDLAASKTMTASSKGQTASDPVTDDYSTKDFITDSETETEQVTPEESEEKIPTNVHLSDPEMASSTSSITGMANIHNLSELEDSADDN